MKRLASIIQLAACVLLFVGVNAHAQDKKVDPTGTWTWSTPGRDGQTRETTLKLKMEGEKLTGTVSGMRGGNETKIEQAKLTGDQISFNVTREFQGNSFTAKYSGKVSGESITGKVTTERGGESREREWTAKRKKEESK
jgi:hypothetical protein